jgi:hypothetical protein
MKRGRTGSGQGAEQCERDAQINPADDPGKAVGESDTHSVAEENGPQAHRAAHDPYERLSRLWNPLVASSALDAESGAADVRVLTRS